MHSQNYILKIDFNIKNFLHLNVQYSKEKSIFLRNERINRSFRRRLMKSWGSFCFWYDCNLYYLIRRHFKNTFFFLFISQPIYRNEKEKS